MITVWKIFTFDSAHYLPDYDGKCANMHGHTYKLEVGIEGSIGPNGMVLDFAILSRIVKENIIEVLDHSVINDTIDDPTAENMCYWIHDALSPIIRGMKLHIRLWETPTSYVEYHGGKV